MTQQTLQERMRDPEQPCTWSDRAQAADELDRLTACLAKANSQTEHFEREWYLRGDELDRLATCITKINDIRNSIIGAQRFNWSEHAYPLVAALEEVGIEGEEYPAARANVGTLIERANKAEAENAELRQERDALAAALNKYGQHHTNCLSLDGFGCSCGLEIASENHKTILAARDARVRSAALREIADDFEPIMRQYFLDVADAIEKAAK